LIVDSTNAVLMVSPVVQRLANTGGADRLAKALTSIGKVEKTIFLLRWLHDPKLRSETGLQTKPWRAPAESGAVAVLRQPRGVPGGRLRGDHE
jgi:hypothetical protein